MFSCYWMCSLAVECVGVPCLPFAALTIRNCLPVPPGRAHQARTGGEERGARGGGGEQIQRHRARARARPPIELERRGASLSATSSTENLSPGGTHDILCVVVCALAARLP